MRAVGVESEEFLASVINILPSSLEAFEAGVFVEFLLFVIPIVFGDELDLSSLVVLTTFGGGDDCEKLPVGVMDGALKIVLEVFLTFVGVGRFDEVVDESKEEGAIARAHQLLGGLGFLLPAMERKAAFVVAILALARAEGFLAHGWDSVSFLSHAGSFEKSRN